MKNNMTELNLNEMETGNGGAEIMQGHEIKETPVLKIAAGAACGSGIPNGTYRPGGVMAAAIGGAMGAFSALCDWITGAPKQASRVLFFDD